MKTLYACGFAVCFILSGCYTQLYTQGYASRSLDAPASGYAREPQNESDTLAPGEDSALAAEQGDTSARGTVVVNNYYRESPYYRGYLVDEWEYPTISLGFYSSRYRDYNGAYWWNDPYYHSYHRGDHRVYRGHRSGGYPSGGGGSPGPYTSDKRLFSNPPPRVTKGHRSSSGSSGNAAPAPKQGAENSAPKAEAAPANPPADNDGSSGSNSGDSEDQKPKPAKGRRR